MDKKTKALLLDRNSPELVDRIAAGFELVSDNHIARFVRDILENNSHLIEIYGTSSSGKSYFASRVIEELSRHRVKIIIIKQTFEGMDSIYQELIKKHLATRTKYSKAVAATIDAMISDIDTRTRKAIQAGKPEPEIIPTYVLLDDVQALETEEEVVGFAKLLKTFARVGRHSGFRAIVNLQSLTEVPKRVRSNVTTLVLTMIDDEYAEILRKTYFRNLTLDEFLEMELPAYSLIVKHKLGNKRQIFLTNDYYL